MSQNRDGSALASFVSACQDVSIDVNGLNQLSQLQEVAAGLLGPLAIIPGEPGVVNPFYPPGDIRRYGADPLASPAANTRAVNYAINAAATAPTSAIRPAVYVPDAVYEFAPATPVTAEGGPKLAAFIMRSNLFVLSDGGTLKLADGCSTDQSPVDLCAFFSNEQLDTLQFVRLTIDMNGANNPISPDRASGTYNRFGQAHIEFSGTPGGVAARGNNVVLDTCKFLNTAGVSCVVMQQSNSLGVDLSQRWTVQTCQFLDNGLDTDDHSSVFGWAEDVVCEACTFDETTMYATVGKTGGLTAYEVHGANTRFVNNRVRNYYRGLWVAPNLTNAVRKTIIAGNDVFTQFYGVEFFRTGADQTLVEDTLITGNQFTFDDSVPIGTLVYPDQKAVVQIAQPYSIGSVMFTGNVCVSTATTLSSAVAVVAPASVAAQPHAGIVGSENTATGFAAGLICRTNATNGVTAVTWTNNHCLNFTPAGVSSSAVGVFADGASALGTLVVGGNAFVDTRGVPEFDYGVYLAGVITDLRMPPNVFKGLTTFNYFEAGATITRRDCYLDAISYTPTVKAGSAITIGDGAVAGSWSMKGKAVTVFVNVTVGATTSFPGGALSVSVPFTGGAFRSVGGWELVDATGPTPYGGPTRLPASGTEAGLVLAAGDVASNTAPVTLATGDTIAVSHTYMLP